MKRHWGRMARRPGGIAAGPMALALSLFLAACGQSAISPQLDDVHGEWDWIRATGGIAGITRTPESDGYSMTLRFLESGEVEFERDGELQGRTTFAIENLGSGGLGDPTFRVRYAEPLFGFGEQDARIDGSRLTLIDGCCDGFAWEFERIN